MSSSCHMEQKTFIEASCNNNIHTEEKVFCSSYVWRFESRFFLDRVKKLVVYLVYMTFLSTSREDKTNWILFMRSKLVFYM